MNKDRLPSEDPQQQAGSEAGFAENEYGILKRLDYAEEVIARNNPAVILDVGCGTGTLLTAPLARRFPQTQFVGTDLDAGSLSFAREHHRLPNLHFFPIEESAQGQRFDMIIVSEVLEHVDDPLAFLTSLRFRLRPSGLLFLTVPNGYGPFEWAMGVEALLRLSGVYVLLRTLKRRLLGAGTVVEATGSDTLAVSPHLNFFSSRSLANLLASAGLQQREYRARTFLCGFILSSLIRTERAIRWNARVADRLPAHVVSDWMVVVEAEGTPTGLHGYRRGWLGTLRRRLNERRWGLPAG